MSIKQEIQDAMKDALRNRETLRLDCLRMAKGALLVKEKDGTGELTDDMSIAILRSEVKKRQQSIETYQELGKDDVVDVTKQEIVILESFLPQQLSAEDLEAKVHAYLTDHPEINHAGRLTGAMKKELGDAADGKMLNTICQQVLGG
ncbi:MAG: GatB/YqeY domain-containing protein [Candidatus Hydrogenedentota bacterium]